METSRQDHNKMSKKAKIITVLVITVFILASFFVLLPSIKGFLYKQSRLYNLFVECLVGMDKCWGPDITKEEFLTEMKKLELSKEYMLKRVQESREYWQKECPKYRGSSGFDEKVCYEKRLGYINTISKFLNEIPD